MSELEKVLRLHNPLCEDSSDSGGESSVYTKFEQLYCPAKFPIETNTDSDISTRRRRKGKRKPTRKPDPNIYNRNALQARENRRKKKAHLEGLESKLQECQHANAVLLKALKRQLKTIHRLEHEKLYYKNILSNRQEIIQLIITLNRCLSDKTLIKMPSNQNSQKSPNQNSHIARQEIESLQLGCDFSDTETENPFILEETWQDLLNDDSLTSGIAIPSHEGNVDTKLNLTPCAGNENRTCDQLTGICLHISSGKVSLEFCPSCHWSTNERLPLDIFEEKYNEL